MPLPNHHDQRLQSHQTIMPTALHITDIYFFEQFSEVLGLDAGICWLSSVPYKNRKARQTSSSPASQCRIRPKLKELPRKTIHNSTANYTMDSSPVELHAWDIAPTEQALPSDIQIDRSRSAPVFATKRRLEKSKSGNFGLLFTDAAHTVIGDFEFDAFDGL